MCIRDRDVTRRLEAAWHQEAEKKGFVPVIFAPKAVEPMKICKNEWEKKAEQLVEKLTDEELIAMVIGEVSKGQENALGAAGIMVPGAAGETLSLIHI